MDYDYYGWRPYVTAAARRGQAARALLTLRKQGREIAPVRIDGRKIATTFWGKAWCENLERYSDFANRLPRGRTYVRNGSVLDLQIASGGVMALVSGSDVYEVRMQVSAVPKGRWRDICRDCTGAIDSLVELLQGRLSTPVMTRICEPATGLFPAPRELSFQCSCPDWASMCKHVAAVLYGVGARLDARPDLLFLLRSVDQQDLIAQSGSGLQPAGRPPASSRVLDTGDLPAIFDIEMAPEPAAGAARRKRPVAAGSARAGAPVRARVRAVAAGPVAPAPAKPAAPKPPRPAARGRAKAAPAPKAVRPAGRRRALTTAAQRAAVVERMKAYWRKRKKR